MSNYVSKIQKGKTFQLRYNDLKTLKIKHFSLGSEDVAKFLPRDTDLYILKAIASRMEIMDYIFMRPAHMEFELEIRRIK